MKKSLFLCFAVAVFASCGDAKKENADPTKPEAPKVDTTLSYFGDTISTDGAVPVAEVMGKMRGLDSLAMKVTGTINGVCQKKGCWMEMDLGNEQSMRVTFKDYAFFVPKDASGKTVYIDGFAYLDTTSVAELRHYAEDAGESKAEIEKITEPEIELSFEARGVIIKK
ncbi:MAG: hypothetical protein FD123_2793 [Bacteroidetes bacterium]|nr:MAG: hypothetical protein FD123_2793 [Bacteroidota bacterium]